MRLGGVRRVLHGAAGSCCVCAVPVRAASAAWSVPLVPRGPVARERLGLMRLGCLCLLQFALIQHLQSLDSWETVGSVLVRLVGVPNACSSPAAN